MDVFHVVSQLARKSSKDTITEERMLKAGCSEGVLRECENAVQKGNTIPRHLPLRQGREDVVPLVRYRGWRVGEPLQLGDRRGGHQRQGLPLAKALVQEIRLQDVYVLGRVLVRMADEVHN